MVWPQPFGHSIRHTHRPSPHCAGPGFPPKSLWASPAERAESQSKNTSRPMSAAAFLAKAEKAVPRNNSSTIAQDPLCLTVSDSSATKKKWEREREMTQGHLWISFAWNVWSLCFLSVFVAPLEIIVSWFEAINIHQPPKNRLTRDASLGWVSWLTCHVFSPDLLGNMFAVIEWNDVAWLSWFGEERRKKKMFFFYMNHWIIYIHINIHKPEHFSHGAKMILRPFWNFGHGMQWPHLVNGHLARVLARLDARPGPWFQQVPAGSKTVLQPLGGVLALGLQLLPKAGNPGTARDPGSHPHHIGRTTLEEPLVVHYLHHPRASQKVSTPRHHIFWMWHFWQWTPHPHRLVKYG